MNELKRLFIGTLLSPFMFMPVLIINNLLYKPPDWAPNYDPGWSEMLLNFFRFIYPVSFIGLLVFGVPCYLILKRYGYANYFSLAGIGFLGGAAPGILATPVATSMLFYGGCGLIVSSGFCLFALYIPLKLSHAEALTNHSTSDAPGRRDP